MKKVLLIMPLSTLNWGEKNAGGVDSVCQMLVRELASKTQPSKYHYRVLAFDPSSQEQYTGRPIHLSEQVEVIFSPVNENRIGLPLPGILTGWLRIREQISNYKPDIVHAHMNSWMIWPGGRTKNILTLHSHRKIARKPVSIVNDFLYEKIVPFFCNFFVDVFTCVGVELGDALKKDTRKPIYIIGNPLDFRYQSKKNEIPITGVECITLITCALISRRKRIDLILSLLMEIKRSGRSVVLKVIGPNVDSAYFSELESLISQWGLHENVQFIGGLTQKEIALQYSKADVGVFLSEQETFGLVPLEMLLAGLPLIATPVGILGEMKNIFEDLGVVFYSKENEKSIAMEIEGIKSIDVREAQDFLHKTFSPEFILSKYENVYDEMTRSDC
ncbi:VpsD family glycosyltransferase [Vibrio metoecus]|uniref:VpsD family glycosyltransferase n=1 Tax=Vibrio metoecus TaxID=1481663 RepID=UPI000BA9C4B6|nr:VpsD family glycosyltransferase [Vibrio metoecus]PAR27075.1 glycosyl transferase family 1 [Vibrio metoecus]PAR37593.1 glycosyl transferase family 1 [Vibrio metoecus]PAR43574.1 glycosyl transferase family 1 [Vibrio metoecus]PAR60269.1 glycosyl transferase family 1 [Vibrio metoecus]WKY92493.1 VpsD family glycosyltransferase [Vibrio metoecus]